MTNGEKEETEYAYMKIGKGRENESRGGHRWIDMASGGMCVVRSDG